MKAYIRIIVLFAVVAVLISAASSCGGKSMDASDSYYPETGNTGSSEDIYKDEASAENVNTAKIIKTATVSAETKDYAKATEDLKALIASVGGNIANSSASESASYYSDGKMERRADYTIKIPSESFDRFLSELGKFLNITNLSTATEDVTETYFSYESRIDTLAAKRAGLLSMLENVDVNTDFETWQKINSELTEIDVQLNYYNELLKNLDSKIARSTVKLSLREVIAYTAVEEKTYGDEVADAFKESFRNVGDFFKALFILFIYVAPFGVIFGLVALGIILIVKYAQKKKRSDNKEKKE